MYKAVIVEDEKPILELMKHLIGRHPSYRIVGAFASPLEALEKIGELRPDVAFLDVEMPKLSGIELAHKLAELSERTQIVFTTAYRHYAFDAFGVSAVDYILKPVTPAAIERVTGKLRKQLAEPQEIAGPAARQASIRCFGGFEVRDPDGAPVKWPTRKTEELFAYFLCHPGQEIGKWRLMDLLWPDMEEERAAHNLYNTVYRLKKLLTEHAIPIDVRKTNDGYRMEAQAIGCDLLEFLRCSAGLNGELSGSAAEAELAERLVSLYRGALFDNKDYDWRPALEATYANRYAEWVKRLYRQDREAGRLDKAERRLEAHVVLFPLDEEMNRTLAELYRESGQAERLAKHVARFAEAFRSELGLEPPIM